MSPQDDKAIATERSALPVGILLIVVSVFWFYISFVTVAQWQLMRQSISWLKFPTLEIQALQSVIMFVPLVALMLVSRHVGYDRQRWKRQVLAHFGLAVLFGMTSRPSMMIARAIAENLTLAESFARTETRGLMAALPHHIYSTMYDALQYLVLQGFIMGLTFYRRFRQEQQLRETLTAQYERARLSALRMQINPHFLYNTLSAIAGLVRTSPAAAEGMVTRLGDLFRRALAERNAELVGLQQELEYAESYLEIQRMRFADRLTYEIQSDAALKEVTLPPLLLQPLLENAVEHGLHECEGVVSIALVCRLEGENVEVVVRNKSEGAPLLARTPRVSHGLGLRNVRERLEAAFGSTSELTLSARGPGDYETLLRFPYRAPGSREAAGAVA